MSSPAPTIVADAKREDWFKDAIIYQCHVKAFQDSNGDGIGDFAGLMQRLDHVQSLGATAVWILPFYPSPLRDDGYDIAEYKAVNPQYGTLEDFQAFVEEAHRRGLKVITELVINHTSDQHEWFQRARRAPKGSPERDFYVWSDDPNKWMDKTRVIFNDTHDSNWTWDPVAEQFYWHRFFDHQPDLNFDNPEVLSKVLEVMHFWLDMGVDGLRLDAIPYLVERDGTNNENLPETHDVLKAIRKDLDEHYSGRMLLAEANQWPEDTRPYFGDGDECHMGFHFPLMPRMYMAVAQEDRHAISDIIRQTPEIPEECQWGIFLRNHDELTLEMVTDRERDYLWETYAADKRARINMGIRRRLAPLMQNDRRKIELLNSMLLSMPGTPIMYYGDEIMMGDNIYLGDRDGVRTPMQWSADRNAGFSRTDPQRLYLPTIQDAIYGYDAVNVEAQAASPSSYLNWIKRMVSVRKRHDVFGRGEIDLLYPTNRKILAYIRRNKDVPAGEAGDGAVLCVANLSRAPQAVEIDLSRYEGRVPVELVGQSRFPPVGELPYMLTLPAYGFFWFLLAPEEEAPDWHTPVPPVLPDFVTLTTRDGTLSTALSGREGAQFEQHSLPQYVALQRWFAGKSAGAGSVSLRQLGEFEDGRHMLAVAQVETGGETQSYFMPLAAIWDEDALGMSPKLPATLAKLRRQNKVGAIRDGASDEDMARALLGAMREGREISGEGGRLVFAGRDLPETEAAGEPRMLGAEQSNASVAFSDQVILKLYRRIHAGVQPDIEVARFLTEQTDFDATPRLLGTATWVADDGTATVLAAVSEYVANQGDAWSFVTEGLDREMEAREIGHDGDDRPLAVGALDLGTLLGRRTGQMHLALSSGEGAFGTDPFTQDRLSDLVAETRKEVEGVLSRIDPKTVEEDARAPADAILSRRDEILARIDAVADITPSGAECRVHGDYHLGQVLVAQNDVAIIDFEGEPSRSLAERQAKSSPLRDVAGMLRSFDYALWTALARRVEGGADRDHAAAQIDGWRKATAGAFLTEWRRTVGEELRGDAEFEAAMLDLWMIRKCAYEIAYEREFRPSWIGVPMKGLLQVLGGR
ncbi:maltose alpha-D-glucosyltransferase [Jannaschia aquimarina]|uniref:maltose alpha-D-glucosyltransferase n=1 Tax=Jannaschia aquimarina TaxID=935700 RepID=A0A0D1EKR5_9RHOB|nr:maltose alpha-D-glucosyltransferase [Jannaschia aquimarina]KIT17601.1 Trehalose synthase/amylase TreS [Jannaschia aquimarina]SNS71702.1 trehalose synthase /maltokinase [Jannaschia aquimarina]